MARGGMHISVRHLLMQVCVFETNLASAFYAKAVCRNCGDTPARTRHYYAGRCHRCHAGSNALMTRVASYIDMPVIHWYLYTK